MSFSGAADFAVGGRIDLTVNAAGLQQMGQQLKGVAQQAQATGRSVQQSLANVGSSLRNIGGKATVGITTPLVGLAVGSIKAASDVHESMSAVETVFGSTAQSIIDFSKTSATALGQSQNATLSAASELGALFKGVGLSADQMADFSKHTLQAASDLGSFYNVDPGTALQDIQSGLVGQSEPLRKYGILLSEAAVQQKAFAQTGKTNASELTEQEKVAARYALIMEQMGAAQGDFARTSNGLANRTRILKAQLADTAATLGTQLLPLALQAANGLSRIVTAFQGLSPRVQRFILIGAGIAAALGPVLIVVGSIASGVAALIPVFGGIATAVALIASPIGLVVGALVLLGIAYKTNFLGFADLVNGAAGAVIRLAGRVLDFTRLGAALKRFPAAFGKIGEAIATIARAFKSGGLKGGLDALFGHAGRKLLAGVGDALSAIPKLIGDVLKGITTGFAPLDRVIHLAGSLFTDFGRLVQEVFQGDFRGALAVAERMVGHLVDFAVAYLRLLPAAFVAVFQAIPWGTVGTFLLNGLIAAIGYLGEGALWLVQFGADLLAGLLNGAVDALPGVLSWLGELSGKLLDAVGDAAKWLYDTGVDLLGGLWRGAVDGAAKVWDFVVNIPTLLGQLMRNAGDWLNTAGWNLMVGFAKGIYDGFAGPVKTALGWVTDQIPDWKGPAERDRKLLFRSGQLVMQGFGAGLQSEFGQIRHTLGQMTAALSGTQTTAFSVGVHAAGARPIAPPAPLTRAGTGRAVTFNGGIHVTVSGTGLNERQLAETTAQAIMSKVRLLDAQYDGGTA